MLLELPAAIARRATIGPDGTGRWIAIQVPETMAADEFLPGDVAFADIDRAGLEDPGPYLIVIDWRDGSVSTVLTHLDGPLFTKRGKVRALIHMRPLGPVLEGDNLGVTWWPIRCRWRGRLLPMTVQPERDLFAGERFQRRRGAGTAHHCRGRLTHVSK